MRGSAGLPTIRLSIAPASISSVRSATSSWSTSRRSAEQRWPAERKAEVTTSCTTCSGRAVESTIIALMPPVSAISGMIGRSSSAIRVRAMRLAVAVEPVKATPAMRTSSISSWPDLRPADGEHERVLGDAGGVGEPTA